MKYRVIGWTSIEAADYPFHLNRTENGECVLQAIIENIRKHGYRFGGDAHERYCPILNDGTKVEFSWRDWGEVMARAWGVEGKMGYMKFYMDELIPEADRRYPDGMVETYYLAPLQEIRDTIELVLDDAEFASVRQGKCCRFYPYNAACKKLDYGDLIVCIHRGHADERLYRTVEGISVYKDFSELYERYKEEIGDREEGFLAEMRDRYGEDEGAAAITLGKLCHAAKSYAYLTGSSDPMVALELEPLFGDVYCRPEGYVFGETETYDINLNNMVRRTIEDLTGREEEAREFLKEHGMELHLKVLVYLEERSAEKKPILPPDRALIDFLHNSGAKLEIEVRTY